MLASAFKSLLFLSGCENNCCGSITPSAGKKGMQCFMKIGVKSKEENTIKYKENIEVVLLIKSRKSIL